MEKVDLGKIEMADPRKVETREPFRSLHAIKEETYRKVLDHMRVHGYDVSQPIVVWDGFVVDGHTRLRAAAELRKEGVIESVAVCRHSFASEQEAKEYAFHNQRDRRNLSPSEMLDAVRRAEVERKRGRPAAGQPRLGKSSKAVAQTTGISARQVERARKINKSGDKSIEAAVRSGKMSLEDAENELKKKEAGQKGFVPCAGIGWAQWEWSPLLKTETGFELSEGARWASRANRRRRRAILPQGATSSSAPKSIFMPPPTSLWEGNILNAATEAPRLWNFIFLTARPDGMSGTKFPDNFWKGARVGTQAAAEVAEAAFARMDEREVKLMLCALKEEVRFRRLELVDWLIFRCADGFRPGWKYMEELVAEARRKNCSVYFEPGFCPVLAEFPDPTAKKNRRRDRRSK